MSTISETIEISLREDREEALQHGEVCANDGAVEACKEIATFLGTRLDPPMKWAAFGEDGGGVTLVLRLRDRRVDFRISPNGRNVKLISIDEHMKALTGSFRADNYDSLETQAWWVGQAPEAGQK